MFILVGVCVAFIAAIALTPLAIKLAIKFNIIDKPNARKVHTKPIPRMGGIALYAAFVLGVLVLGVYTRQVAALLLGSTIVMAVGLIDDIFNISPRIKLLGQVIASLVVVFGGFYVQFITNPFVEGGIISLGIFSIPITVIWLTGISNAVNLIDGLDGLSAGVSTIAAICMAIVCIYQGSWLAAALAFILAAAALGFLPYNFNPAKTFMGDCGSLFLGFVLGALAVMSLSKGATFISVCIPLIIMGIPIFDTCFAILRRMVHNKPIFEADKGHLHHRLLSMGLSHRNTVIAIYAISSLMGLAAVLMAMLTSAQAIAILVFVTIVIFAGASSIGVLGEKRLFIHSHSLSKKKAH